jgi:ComF family protein
LRSWAVYQGGLRNAIHRLKYAGDLALGEILARPLLEMLQLLQWDFDLVAPVPISLARKKMRGYNQASMLALPIALGSGAVYRPQALQKVQDSPSQVGLTAAQRRLNVQAAFRAQENYAAGKAVLVIDDITTSGATMEACSNALLRAGARQVFGLTLARAVLDNA